MKKDLLYKFYPDLQMNNIDPRRIHEPKLKLRLLMRFSDNSDYFPMIKATTKYTDLEFLISAIGGFWSSIVGLMGILFGTWLFNKFMQQEAKNVIKLKGSDSKFQEELTVDEVETRFKERISFQGLYALFDKTQELSDQMLDQEIENKQARNEIEASEQTIDEIDAGHRNLRREMAKADKGLAEL